MFLHMATIIEQQFRDAHLGPIKSTVLRGHFIRQSFDPRSTFIPAIIQIGLKLVLRINPLGKQSLVELAKCEWSRWGKSFNRVGEVKVQPEKAVIGHIPKLSELRLC